MEDQQPQQQEINAIGIGGGLNLPPGFRFHPSDDEIVSIYLKNKVCNGDITSTVITEVDLNKTEPWDLPREAKMGEKEWYFFYRKDRKYPTGMRANRATEAGYWKATGKDKEVYNTTTKGVVLLVGLKKTLVFYKGRAPRGDKTDWVMHEYRLEGNSRLPSTTSPSSSAANATTMECLASASKDEWVVCRVFDKTTRTKKVITSAYQVTMAGVETDPNQNNIPAIPIPLTPQLPLPMPMPMQFHIQPHFAMDSVAPYYPNTNVGVTPMTLPMAGIGGAGGPQIDDSLFQNQIAAPLQMNFYHQMGMRAATSQMDMGAAGVGGYDAATLESRLASMMSQKDEQANAAEILSMMPMASQGFATTTIEMDGIWEVLKK